MAFMIHCVHIGSITTTNEGRRAQVEALTGSKLKIGQARPADIVCRYVSHQCGSISASILTESLVLDMVMDL
jgi:hypothetical protein